MTPQHNQTDLDFILRSLYEIDPSLREHEGELKKLLSKLHAVRPDIKIDKTFAAELRRDLLSYEPKTSPLKKFLESMNKIPLYAGGVATIALVALIGYNMTSDKGPLSDKTVAVLGGVTNLAPGSFGNLSGAGSGAPSGIASEALSSYSQIGSGSGIGLASPVVENADVTDESIEKIVRPQSGGGGLVAPSSLIYPAPSQSTFEYGGEEYVISETSSAVYRRNKAVSTASALGNLVAQQSNGVLNLSRLGNMDLVNFQLHEKTGNYLININLRDGRININQDYQDGQLERGFDKQITIDDVPADAKLIKTASDFLKRFGIDTSSYGEAVVDNTWRVYAKANTGRYAYVPHIVNVIFPIEVDGQTIYDQGGNKHGLSVQVNVILNTVTGVNNLMTMNYDKSSYELETDFTRIKEFALRGGINGAWYGRGEGGVLTLKTPELIYMNYTQYNQEERRSQELFIPALRFEFTEQTKELGNVPRSIIVPLVKDILDIYQRNIPIMMPLIEPAVMGMPVPEPSFETTSEMEVIELESIR